MRSNLPALLDMNDALYDRGAGRGILFERHTRVRVAYGLVGWLPSISVRGGVPCRSPDILGSR